MWQSFRAIGRRTSEIEWQKKEDNITGKTLARPERLFRAA